MSELAKIFAATEKKMRAEFDEARAAFDHSGLKGNSFEEIVRNFLSGRLPPSIGVTVGKVIDSDGSRSLESDVIIYNANRTPMIFTSAQGGNDLVPVEGVLAVVEVKANLTKALLPGVLKNCRSVKSLRKTAFTGPPVPRFNAYGESSPDFPTLFSVFSFESDSLYAGALNELHKDVPLDERIDLACSLDRGINLNVTTSFDYAGPHANFSPVAQASGALVDIKTDHALMVWFVSLSGLLLQADSRPIQLLNYMRDELQFDGTMPGGAGLNPIIEALGQQLRINPSILQKLLAREALSTEELAALEATGATLKNFPGIGPDIEQTPDEGVEQP